MITPRTSHTATLLPDGRVLVAGGLSSDLVTQAELYDPSTGSWTATGTMVEGRYGHTATRLPDGTVLVAGGFTNDSDVAPSASAELFSPASGTWTSLPRMASPRAGHTATLLPGGAVLVAGGASHNGGNGGPLDGAELYDSRTGAWTTTSSLTEARASHTATMLPDGTVLVAGGVGISTDDVSPFNTTLATTELYDPDAGSWTVSSGMDEGRAKHTAALLRDGRVLILPAGEEGSPELYDPVDRSFSVTGSTDQIRSVHSSTALADGTVLAIGGYGDGGQASGWSVELYDPNTGRWSTTVVMFNARASHTATVLLDGSVLVAGGSDEVRSLVALAELYYPGRTP